MTSPSPIERAGLVVLVLLYQTAAVGALLDQAPAARLFVAAMAALAGGHALARAVRR